MSSGGVCMAGVCTPSPLASLSVSPLTLRPDFSPSVHDYAVACPAATNELTVDMNAIGGGSVALSAPILTAAGASLSLPLTLTPNQAVVVQA
ncbi:MAG TPA: hypothetical protein VMT89_09285, partial [Candidatus Acidoferrales bacterium]|nr:hypothetical protein [Candidatus Acidoferrales bacterium]